jgi:hypothetical protein
MNALINSIRKLILNLQCAINLENRLAHECRREGLHNAASYHESNCIEWQQTINDAHKRLNRLLENSATQVYQDSLDNAWQNAREQSHNNALLLAREPIQSLVYNYETAEFDNINQ